MAVIMARHVESVAGSGAASVVVLAREWSRIVAVSTACQGVMELRRVRCREWSRTMAIIVTCQEAMKLRRIQRREWSSAVCYCGLPGGQIGRAHV